MHVCCKALSRARLGQVRQRLKLGRDLSDANKFNEEPQPWEAVQWQQRGPPAAGFKKKTGIRAAMLLLMVYEGIVTEEWISSRHTTQ